MTTREMAPEGRTGYLYFIRIFFQSGVTGPDDPAPDIRVGTAIIAGFFVVFLGWAALARVDAAITARGTIVVSGSRQEVQHKEGGIVEGLHVREGDQVSKGEILIDLAGAETEATANGLIAQYIDLKTREARLLAEQVQTDRFGEPAVLADLGTQYRPLIDSALLLQQRTLTADRNYMATQQSVLAQRVRQTEQQIAGAQEQMTANRKQQVLARDELIGVQDLQAKGYAPMTRVRALQQSIAALEGDYGALQANAASAEAKIGETHMQAVSLRKQFLDQVIADLSDTQSRLKALEPQMIAARANFERLHVRATATGKVMGLSAFTVGGVITPGQKLMDIVPEAAPLVIQAFVDANDGSEIKPGQQAQVRFTSLHERDVPLLTGQVLDVSGDTFTDNKNNRSFYTARIQISPQTMATLNRVFRGNSALKPGLPVEVIVPLRKRTVLQYLFEPLNQSLWKSFRER